MWANRAPSMNELRNLLEAQRRLESAEALERSRERSEDSDGSRYTGLSGARWTLVMTDGAPAIGERLGCRREALFSR